MLYNCPVILFMFDITNVESYIRIKKIIKYISLIDKEVKILKILVGNKIDIEKERTVSGFEAQSFLNHYKGFLQYMDISALTKENISELVSLIYSAFTSPLVINRTSSSETILMKNNSDDSDASSTKAENYVCSWLGDYPPEFKMGTQIYNIILIGDDKVGKSMFLTQLDANNKQANGLININDLFKYVKIRNTEIKIHIWDTAGLEKYKSLTQNYYKQADGVIVMYDITEEKTLYKGEKWYKDAKDSLRKDVITYLVGNKIDLSSEKKIHHDKVSKIALVHNMKCLDISCKYKVNIDELIKSIVYDIYSEGPEDKCSFSFDSMGKAQSKSAKKIVCC